MANGNGKNGKKNGNGGRPTRYDEKYPDLAFRFILLKKDATDGELARLFDVTETTINNWKNAHPEFLESIKEAKDRADANVVNALYQQAMAGNVGACCFWLKNRQGWRDRVDLNHGIDDDSAKNLAKILGVKPEDIPE